MPPLPHSLLAPLLLMFFLSFSQCVRPAASRLFLSPNMESWVSTLFCVAGTPGDPTLVVIIGALVSFPISFPPHLEYKVTWLENANCL